MYRDDRNLVRKYLRGEPVPLARLKEVIAAAFNRFRDDGVGLDFKIVLRFLGELRPDGSKRWIGRSSTIVREALRPLLNYVRGDRVPQAELEKIIAAECVRLQDVESFTIAEMVLRILDGLRPEDQGRKAKGR